MTPERKPCWLGHETFERQVVRFGLEQGHPTGLAPVDGFVSTQ